jgi:hypothetical protein
MQPQYSIESEALQASARIAQDLSRRLTTSVQPLLVELDALLDLRLVQTFLATLHVLLELRHRNNGLLLSELGAYLASPDHAPAGTKRLSNLLHSSTWASQFIENFLWQQANERLVTLEQAEEEALLMWDESVIEKSESIALKGLCAVRSVPRTQVKADQARLLQSSRWSSHFRARNELARCALAWSAGTPYLSCDAMVDHAWHLGANGP